MSITSNMKISYVFIDELSIKGTSVKYINFLDDQFRLTSEQKDVLKKICNGYFFYSKTKKMWGFTNKGENEFNVSNFLNTGIIPDLIEIDVPIRNKEILIEQLPFNVDNFKFNFYEMDGRPLFYTENLEESILININLKHWFFVEKSGIEKEFAKKMVLSLVGAKLEFTSITIESFFTKLNSIQSNLKYEYAVIK
jgi:hypothetical protein